MLDKRLYFLVFLLSVKLLVIECLSYAAVRLLQEKWSMY